eukprot:TRINITY_DN8271_c0_g1_i1.p1 TRINITY_DN8271_c0_g1~~TRINITY_DN8271_c0_g1_i1.p1  ORF type:complete len:335 (+),score=102.70 TRINITY_DN8271_c0_g1_i1:24-1007(+)
MAALRRMQALRAHISPTLQRKQAASDATSYLQGGWALHRVPAVNPDDLCEDRSLQGRTLFVTGASRGIGLAIAKRAARDGANIVIAAKTAEPHPKLEGTIYTAAEEIESVGGQALPLVCDIRDEAQVTHAVQQAVDKFGGIDILVNNASAINLTDTANLDMKRYDLMHDINTRGTFLVTKACLPHLIKGTNPHVLTLSPPLDKLHPKWFENHVAYTMAKYGMSMCVLGHSAEFAQYNIGVNALWPRTTIATAAVANLLGGAPLVSKSRTPDIMADAAHAIFTRRSDRVTGNFFVDDEVLLSEGVTDLTKYNVDKDLPAHELAPDFFV